MTGDDALRGLTPVQREAAAYSDGPALVVAGPGSGKTRTLVARLVHQIATGLARPEEILAVTFTRKAAGELRARLAAALGDVAGRVTVGTFHQVALLLRPLAAGPGQPAALLLGEGDQLALAERVLAALPAGKPTRATPARLVEAVSRLKGHACDWERGLPATAAAHGPWLLEAVRLYDEWMRALGAEDLDDLLIAATRAVREGRAGGGFRSIQVDEYQDVNGVQRELLCSLAATGARLFAIGDPDQAIYAFRGAESRHFHAFASDFPGARTFYLGDNFRSTATLVTASGALIARNPDRPVGFAPRAARSGGEPVTVQASPSATTEAIGVAREIERLIGGTSLSSHDQRRSAAWAAGRYGFADIAVLTRTVARADRVAEALAHEGLPILRPRRAHLLDDDARDLLGYLRLLADPGDLGALLRVRVREGYPPTLGELEALRAQRAAGQPAELPVALLPLAALPPAERLERLAAELGVSPSSLGAVAAELARGEGLAAVQPIHESDEWDERLERVAVLTLHGSKGLEFPVVFLCGCEADLMPGPAAASDPELVAEERRLFYVGMTRARDLLYVSYLSARRSPFLDELPGEQVFVPPPPKRRDRPPQLKLF